MLGLKNVSIKMHIKIWKSKKTEKFSKKNDSFFNA